jgi:hypothetical protein
MKRKILVDILFIVISTTVLIGLIEYGLLEKYIGFSLIPILIAYFLGQFVKSKFK